MTTKQEIEYLIGENQAVARHGHKTIRQALTDGGWPETLRNGLIEMQKRNAVWAAQARLHLIGLLAEQ